MKMQANAMRVLAACSTIISLLLSGCGNQVSLAGNTISGTAKSTMTQTVITDAPADQVLSLSLTIDSITATDSAGASTTILSTPVTIEASHLDAVHEPLLPPLNIPQDTYVSATFTVSDPVVTYVDSTGTVVKVNATLSSATDTVTFNSPITVGATAAPICFDLLVGQSVSISGSTVSVTPTFNVTQVSLAASPTNNNNGKLSGILGKVVSTGTNSLIITGPSGQQLTIATDANTVFQGFTALSQLSAGNLVDMDVAQQASGTLLALRIHLEPAQASNLLVGPVTAVTGSPATSFTEVVRQPLGPNVSAANAATTYTITISGPTTFGLAPQAGTLPSLPFTASFSSANLTPGQNVAVAAGTVSGTAATATAVYLAPQTVDGTVASLTTSGSFTVYTVTLPSGSALARLSGASSVVVYVNSSTQMMNATAVAVGGTVRYNGLLFNDSGTLRLLAGASCDGPPSPPPQKH